MSLRERLTGRPRPTATYMLQIDDTAEAERELGEAQTVMLMASDDRKDAARQAVRDAQAKLEACFEAITLTALPPEEFEALVEAHPPRKDTSDEAWNTKTFPRACFLACAPDDLTAEEWEEFFAKRCSDGELVAMFTRAIDVNVRTPDPSIPKGLMEILG